MNVDIYSLKMSCIRQNKPKASIIEVMMCKKDTRNKCKLRQMHTNKHIKLKHQYLI
jgi:hypothetical protein